MKIEVNRERLAGHFVDLCQIDSPSQQERGVADYLLEQFGELQADFIHEDDSAAETGSDSGNLIVRFEGTAPRPPIFFACHMDTVKPGIGVEVARTGDTFTSRGDTILGSDDKSGIAPLIELAHLLREGGVPHRTIELVFTTCEEVGLRGAKALDHGRLQARFGCALDSTGIDKVITGAPAANRFRIDIRGTAAHAGMNPEAGVSALLVAAHAMTRLRLGRVDEESTANIGLIEGGTATNIVPEHLGLKGEVRSHSPAKLTALTEEIKQIFIDTAGGWPLPESSDAQPPTVAIEVEAEYPAMRLDESAEVLETVRQAGAKLGRELTFMVAGGGSDANIFNGYGLPTAIIATGMTDVHTTDESVELSAMVGLTELLYTMAVS